MAENRKHIFILTDRQLFWSTIGAVFCVMCTMLYLVTMVCFIEH